MYIREVKINVTKDLEDIKVVLNSKSDATASSKTQMDMMLEFDSKYKHWPK